MTVTADAASVRPMAALFFTLLTILVVGLGARDQKLLAAMVKRQGARPTLLLVAVATGIASVTVSIWLSQIIAATLAAPARLLFVAMALGLAGLEMTVLTRRPEPREPTNSLGAFAVVLLAGQVTDAVRFVAMGMAVATRAPLVTGLGAAAAVAALAGAAWLAADLTLHPALGRIRRATGLAVTLVSVLYGLRILGLV